MICDTPAVEAGERREALSARRALVPVEGPAVFGFEFLTEVEVREALLASRPWSCVPLLEDRVEEAFEVAGDVRRRAREHDPGDDDCNCRDCVPF